MVVSRRGHHFTGTENNREISQQAGAMLGTASGLSAKRQDL